MDLSKVRLVAGGFTVTGLDFGDKAEKAILVSNEKDKKRKEDKKLTTTKLRGIYALITNVSANIDSEDSFKKNESDIKYLKVKMAYEAGREDSVRDFLQDSKLMALLDDVCSYEKFVLYCRYAESLVAYFKFHGGRDK